MSVRINKELPAYLQNHLQSLQNILKKLQMKSEELQIDILKRQNREMAIKMQFYRTENQQLKSKNQELNQWVGNLSEVFSTLSASWESITTLQETLLTLMKKKSDMKDKTLLRKYQNHFKTYADIINNLSDKIKNAGHSDQATHEAKEQLRSFVNNYELLFKQFIQTYFKYNQDYEKILNDLCNREDVQTNMRTIISKNLQSTQKIKDFEAFMKSLKDNFQMFQTYNNQKLLQGVVQKKQEEIQSLKEKLQIAERRIRIMFDYNNASVDMQIECQQGDFECVCGGVQLAYMKSTWEEKLKAHTESVTKINDQKNNGVKTETTQALQSKLAAMEEEKQNLIIRNSLLVEKISKMNVQNKLTEQVVLRSNVYLSLKEQCQYLMDYVTQLLNKLKKQQEFLYLIQKARDEQVKQIKKRNDRTRPSDEKVNNHLGNNFQNSLQIFKQETFALIKNLTNTYLQFVKKSSKQQQHITNFKNTFDHLRKSNEQLNKKVSDLQNRQINKMQGLQFKYEKYKQVETVAQGLIEKDAPNILQLWKQFIVHVKGRDKKIRDLESALRKKDRQISEKAKIQELMNHSLTQTEKNYLQNKQKLDKTQQFIKKFQSQLVKLAQQNYQTRNQVQQQKSLLNIRLKAQTQARNKLQEKVSFVSKIETQFVQIKQNQSRIRKDYQLWLESHKKELQNCKKEMLEKQSIVKNLNEQATQKQKQLQKLQVEKQNLKSEIRQLKNRVESLMATTENQILKMELNEYKGKIMCSCTGDREREVVLKTCPHLFCKRCIDDTTTNRNRKCPLCGIRFTKTDVHEIKWN